MRALAIACVLTFAAGPTCRSDDMVADYVVSEERLPTNQTDPRLLVSEFETDTRVPSRSDISGIWSSAPNQVGIVVRIDQKGSHVSGIGYHWGCVGSFNAFTFSGRLRGDQLRLRVSEEGKKLKVWRFKLSDGPASLILDGEASGYGALRPETKDKKDGEPGATDNPDDAQRLREDH